MRRRRALAPRTDVASRLWARLRGLEGFHFRRGAPFKTFTLDFVEHEVGLVVDLVAGVPGRRSSHHGTRDKLLAAEGYVILRLWRDEAARDPDYPAQIVGVFSNRADAPGLQYAWLAGIPTAVLSHKDYPDKPAFEAAMDAALAAWQPDILCLAGFMRLLSPGFCTRWAGRLINIHPSLLPLHKGLHTHQQALADGVAEHGCTVHFVVPELDAGPIVAQAAIPVRQDDDPDSLADRVIVQERRLYPAVLALVAGGRARLEGERVVIAGHLDTVPVHDNLPSRNDGTDLYGLGACDMKGGDAVILRLEDANKKAPAL